MKPSPRLALLAALCLGAVACPRRNTNTADAQTAAPDRPTAAPPRPPVTPTPPSADAVVLVPGVGIGPFALGMTRAAVRGLGEQVRVVNPRMLEVDNFAIVFDGDDPAGVVTSVQLQLPRATGGVRVGSSVLANSATYEEVISGVGECAAPIVNLGATVTPCQGGAVKVMRVGPPQEIVFDVSR